MKEIDAKKADELAYSLISVLHGLSIGQALWVLDVAGGWIKSTHSVDANSQDLAEAIQGSLDAET